MGSDNVMFSVDYPFEKTELAAQFMDGAKISETDRMRVASENAKRILRIGRRVGRLEGALATKKK